MSAQILALLELNENALQVEKCLKRSGHDVVVVPTFKRAIAMLQQHYKTDLIISDVHLENGGSIFDFIRWLKNNPPADRAPLVLFSFNPTTLAKYLEDGVRTSARHLGVSTYITMETFDADEFRKQIDSLLPLEYAGHNGNGNGNGKIRS